MKVFTKEKLSRHSYDSHAGRVFIIFGMICCCYSNVRNIRVAMHNYEL